MTTYYVIEHLVDESNDIWQPWLPEIAISDGHAAQVAMADSGARTGGVWRVVEKESRRLVATYAAVSHGLTVAVPGQAAAARQEIETARAEARAAYDLALEMTDHSVRAYAQAAQAITRGQQLAAINLRLMHALAVAL